MENEIATPFGLAMMMQNT